MAQLKKVHITPWPHCTNESVFSDPLNWPYDSRDCLRSDSKLFQIHGAAATKELAANSAALYLHQSWTV